MEQSFLWWPYQYRAIGSAFAGISAWLREYDAPGNRSISEKLSEYEAIRNWFDTQTPSDESGPKHIRLGEESLQMLKAALLRYLPTIKDERERILAEGDAPKGATESIDRTIEFVEGMLNGILASVTPDSSVGVIMPNPIQAQKPQLFKTTTNSYTVVGTIGNGGAGTVFKVEDESRNVWAIKLLSPERATDDKIKRFRTEMLFCKQNTHPNIVRSPDSGFHIVDNREMPFYVMVYCPKTLRTLMKSRMTPEVIVSRFSDILDGLQEAHSKKIWHRDLKPENILHDPATDKVMLADFGIAHFSEEFLATSYETTDNFRMGNFQYAAPEQRVHGGTVDQRTDIFSLGLILNEMFTATLALGHNYPTIAGVASEYSYLDAIVAKMLQADPNRRPQSIGELRQLLALPRTSRSDRKTYSAGGVLTGACDLAVEGICELPGAGELGTAQYFHDSTGKQVNACMSCSKHMFESGEWVRAREI